MTPTRLLFAGPVIALVVACGSRTGLAIPGSSSGGSGSSGSSSGAVGLPRDPCPSAVSGPKAMTGNCSTRDGRSRVRAPTAPHVTWTTKLPTDRTGQVGPSAIATDGSGHAYVITTGEVDETTAALRRVSTTDGSIVWTMPIRPDDETTPIVLSSGGIDMFAYSPADRDSVFTFAPSNGSSTSTDFGFSLYYAPSDLAVGSDGSLYVTHEDGVGTAQTTTYISRVGPDGSVRWSTVDLATLGPPPEYHDGEISPTTIALGKDDLVVVFSYVLVDNGGVGEVSVALAFDPATGAERWSQPIDGQIVGGPAVRPDGTIVAIIYVGGATNLVVLDPASGSYSSHAVSMGALQIYGVTEDGVVIAGADAGNGVTGIAAIADDGSIQWTSPVGPSVLHATIASDGTVIAFSNTIRGLDGATGATKWELQPAVPTTCIVDGALTSDGALVVLECNGTLFGASD